MIPGAADTIRSLRSQAVGEHYPDGQEARKGDHVQVVDGEHKGATGVVRFVTSAGLLSLAYVENTPIRRWDGKIPARVLVQTKHCKLAKRSQAGKKPRR